MEQLEERRLLVSRVFIDFGDVFPLQTTGPFAGTNTLTGVTAAALQANLVGAAGPGQNFNDLLGNFVATPTTGLDLMSFTSYLDFFNPGITPADPATLEASIVMQIKQALEPFDIQVIPADGTIFNFPSMSLANAGALEGLNNLPGIPGAPAGTATATVPQYGSDDVYMFICAQYTVVNNFVVPVLVPISADFAVNVPTLASVPNRLDSGVLIDANYWLDRVLGPGGTGGSYNIALANSAMYGIGWDYGLSEVENGTPGPYTNFFDPNVQLIDQASAMQEGGFTEGESLDGVSTSLPISDVEPAYFPNFNMMQTGINFQPLLQPGTLGNPPILDVPPFPLPPLASQTGVAEPPDFSLNTDPSQTVNLYQELVNDPDIGPNPDVAYVTGSGAYDQIFMTKISPTKAQVTVNAYTDDTYTTLVSEAATEDGDPGVVSTMSYTINLTKIVTPGRKDDGQPFRIVVDGLNSDDQVYLDPTLGVEVEVHGGADVKTLKITGNGTYNVQYTPSTSAAPLGSNTIINTYAATLLPEGLTPGAAGTLLISGTAVTTTTTVVNKKIVTRSTSSPFKTTVLLDHFNPANDSALRLEDFNQLDYTSPGFNNNEYNVADMLDGSWQISGQVDSTFNPPSLTGNLQFNNIKQLVIDTSKGASTDTVSFATGAETPQGLQFVNVVMGAQAFGGTDELDFNDSLNADGSPNLEDQNYLISTTQLLPVQPAGSVFTGYTYSGVELLTLNGTQGADQFTVTPSTTTSYIIDGDPGAVQNTLAVHLAGTQYSESDDGLGNGQWTFGNRKPITFTNIQNIVNQFGENGVDPADYLANPISDNTSPIYAGSDQSDIIALANSGGGKPLVQVYSAITNQLLYQFYAYAQNFVGGVRVTTADVDGDGVPDIIVAPGAGISAEVKVYSGAIMAANTTGPQKFVNNPDTIAGALLTDLTPDSTYKNGLYVAVGDVDGSGTPDLITSHSKGAPLVSVFLNDGSGVFSNPTPDAFFVPYAKTMVAGVPIAVGDTDGDGIDEIVTAPGVGQSNLIKEYSFFDVQANSAAPPIRQFYGFENTFKGGVSLTMADVDGTMIGGNEVDEIILGAGAGGKSRVRVLDGVGTLEREFQAYTTGNINAAVTVLARDIDGSGVAELYTTPVGSATTHTVQLLDPLAVVNPLATPLVAPLVDTIMESSIDLKSGINLG